MIKMWSSSTLNILRNGSTQILRALVYVFRLLIALKDKKTKRCSLTLSLIIRKYQKQRCWISHSFMPTYMHIEADLFIFFFPLTPSFTLLCVSVWYGKNVTHAEAAAAMATTQSPLYGQLTSGLSDLEVQQHKACIHSVLTMRYFKQMGLHDKPCLLCGHLRR